MLLLRKCNVDFFDNYIYVIILPYIIEGVKYMITVNEDKELVFSFLLETDYVLRNKLLLNQPLFQLVLNDERMKNLEEHRKIFYQKEEERKKTAAR